MDSGPTMEVDNNRLQYSPCNALGADGMGKSSEIENDNIIHFVIILELETKVKRRFAKVIAACPL